MTAEQREIFAAAYSQTLIALSRLLSGSLAVAKQMLLLPGAEDVFRQATKGLADAGLRMETSKALEILRRERRLLDRAQAAEKAAHLHPTRSRSGGGGASGSRGTSAGGMGLGAVVPTSAAGATAQEFFAEAISQTLSSVSGSVVVREPAADFGRDGSAPNSSPVQPVHHAAAHGVSKPRPLTQGGARTKINRSSDSQRAHQRPQTAPQPSFSPIPVAAQVMYSMPESPLRRGLSPKHKSRDDDTSLHKAVFGHLPQSPYGPLRLDADQALDFVDQLPSDKHTSARKLLKAVSAKAVSTLEWEGFIHDGKHSVPILERARRNYLPNGAGGAAAALAEAKERSLKRAAASGKSAINKAEKDGFDGNPYGTDGDQRLSDEAKLGPGSRQHLRFGPLLDGDDLDIDFEADANSRSYRSLGMTMDISFDTPTMLQESFRPIYEIDLGPDKSTHSLSDADSVEFAQVLGGKTSNGDFKRALGILSDNVDKQANGGFMATAVKASKIDGDLLY
jgi:hypothetical protein